MKKFALWAVIYCLPFFPLVSAAENMMVAKPTCFTGVVSWFDQQNGYGSIILQMGSQTQDIFVHFTTVVAADNSQKVLFPGQVVEFGMVYDDNIGRNRTTWVIPKRSH